MCTILMMLQNVSNYLHVINWLILLKDKYRFTHACVYVDIMVIMYNSMSELNEYIHGVWYKQHDQGEVLFRNNTMVLKKRFKALMG